jgi:peroxiredoxin/uncharacterized membrane protein YphA (DoxX/SURF4 family)
MDVILLIVDLLLISRLLLAMVFAVSGIAKLADGAGSRQAMRDFGIPSRLVAPLGLLLPLAELALAGMLLSTTFAWWGAVGALALLLLFIGGISYNLVRGRKPACHCFGQLHSEPIGWSTIARNLTLSGLTAFIIWQGQISAGPSLFRWQGMLTLAERIALLGGGVVVALFAATGWMFLVVLRQQGTFLLRIEELEARLAAKETGETSVPVAPVAPVAGLAVGSVAPAFALPDLSGKTMTLNELLSSGKSLLLLFSDPGCEPCNFLLPDIGRWQHTYAGQLTLALISRGTLEGNRAKASEHGITHLLRQQDREIAQSYQVNGTPSAVLVHQDGTISSPLAEGAEAIGALVASTVNLPVLKALPMGAPSQGNRAILPAKRAEAKKGEQAPAFTLPNLSGKQTALADFLGKETVLLFWNPQCGFCERMVEEIRSWERTHSRGAPTLLLVSTGTVEENTAMDLRSPILLDQGLSIGGLFGANGTPMAVHLDGQGIITSELAIGAPAVMALLYQVEEGGKVREAAGLAGEKR